MTYLYVSVVAIFVGVSALFLKQKNSSNLTLNKEVKSIYDITVKDIEGEDFDLAQLKGKKVLIVNTASRCGLTPQYEGLQMLYETYKDQNFVIIGFPSNDFLWEEPGNEEQIQSFCQKNYGVTFPLMSKIKVKGKKMHPLYIYLTQKEYNGHSDNTVKWNFQKYLINESGQLEQVISPSTKPMSNSIIEWIES